MADQWELRRVAPDISADSEPTIGNGSDPTAFASSEPERIGSTRTLGLDQSSLSPMNWTADDLELVDRSLAHAEERAVFVALAIHDPSLTDRTLDAARWATELLVSARASVFALMSMVEPGTHVPFQLEVRQWNHAVALAAELRRISQRRGLAFECFERLDDEPIDAVLTTTALPPIGLDPCGFQADGWTSARLIWPSLD